MNFQPNGLSQDNINIIKKIIEKKLSSLNHFQVFFYGSRARSDYRKYSDLDLWIEMEPSTKEKELMNSLSDEFLESDIPIKVDIVTPRTVLNEYLPSIKSDLKLWFQKK